MVSTEAPKGVNGVGHGGHSGGPCRRGAGRRRRGARGGRRWRRGAGRGRASWGARARWTRGNGHPRLCLAPGGPSALAGCGGGGDHAAGGSHDGGGVGLFRFHCPTLPGREKPGNGWENRVLPVTYTRRPLTLCRNSTASAARPAAPRRICRRIHAFLLEPTTRRATSSCATSSAGRVNVIFLQFVFRLGAFIRLVRGIGWL